MKPHELAKQLVTKLFDGVISKEEFEREVDISFAEQCSFNFRPREEELQCRE